VATGGASTWGLRGDVIVRLLAQLIAAPQSPVAIEHLLLNPSGQCL